MLRFTIAAVLFSLAWLQPAAAEDVAYACDDASLTKLEADISNMSKWTKEEKQMAMKEMAMAKEAMVAKNTDQCQIHLTNMMTAMKKEM
jgi:hypothetical protein